MTIRSPAVLAAFAVTLLPLIASSGCRSLIKPEVPTQKVRLERLEITGHYPPGSERFEAWAMISGYQFGADAELLPPRQWLDGYRVHLEQLERPASAEAAAGSKTTFSRSLPIDCSKLPPGFYIVNVNGSEKRLEIPDPPEPEVPNEDQASPTAPPARGTLLPLRPATRAEDR